MVAYTQLLPSSPLPMPREDPAAFNKIYGPIVACRCIRNRKTKTLSFAAGEYQRLAQLREQYFTLPY